MTIVKSCRCGARRDVRGQCMHCDKPVVCPQGRCAFCSRRDSYCVMCGTDCGAPAAASYHETNCRDAETKKENK